MKKITFLYLLLLFSLISSSTNEIEWVNSSKKISNFDSNGKLFNTIEQNWKNEQWVNREKIEYSYDKDGNEIETLTLHWDTEEWENQKLEKIQYDLNKKISSKIGASWKYTGWLEEFKYIYFYDDNLNLTRIIGLRMMDSVWVETAKDFKKYDDFGNEIESWYQSRKSYYDEEGDLHYADEWLEPPNKRVNKADGNRNIIERHIQVADNGSWKIIEKTIIDYNPENQVVTKLLQERELENDSLVNVNKTEIFYTNFGKQDEILSTWQNGDWENSIQHTFLYNDNGLLTEMVYNVWENNDWVNSFRTIYKHDNDGNEIERLVQEYKIN